MVKAGAAVMLREQDVLATSKLQQTLKELLSAPDSIAVMGAAAKTQARPGAAERIADRLAALAAERERLRG
jgi:UDP-N-acetylglucosamine:LPS N-acetylglucosamine transferase